MSEIFKKPICTKEKFDDILNHPMVEEVKRTPLYNSAYMSCNGCKHHKGGKCILPAPNNCIRDADDYYTDI